MIRNADGTCKLELHDKILRSLGSNLQILSVIKVTKTLATLEPAYIGVNSEVIKRDSYRGDEFSGYPKNKVIWRVLSYVYATSEVEEKVMILKNNKLTEIKIRRLHEKFNQLLQEDVNLIDDLITPFYEKLQ